MISGLGSVIFQHLENSELCKLVRSRPHRCYVTWEEVHIFSILFRVHGFKHNHGFNMSIISWKCVFYSVVFSFLVIFLDTRTGMYLQWTYKLLIHCLPKAQSRLSPKYVFFLSNSRCNIGRFCYGTPKSTIQSGAWNVSTRCSRIWCEGISWKPHSYFSTEKEHPFPKWSQTVRARDCSAGCCKPSELLSSQRWD